MPKTKELRTCRAGSACLCLSPSSLRHCTLIPTSSPEGPWAGAQGSLDRYLLATGPLHQSPKLELLLGPQLVKEEPSAHAHVLRLIVGPAEGRPGCSQPTSASFLPVHPPPWRHPP